MENLKKTLNILNRCGWKLVKHISFSNGENNRIYKHDNSADMVVLWCAGNRLLKSEHIE